MAKTWKVLLMWCFIHTTSSLILKENVFFLKTKEVALSRSSWKLTMVADLDVYDDFFKETVSYIQRVNEAALITHSKFVKTNIDYGHHFSTLRQELFYINRTRQQILDKFMGYNLLHNKKGNNPDRNKRALLPFMGSIFNFLYGVSTDSDLIEVRQAVNELSANQQKIRHVVNQSLSVMNKTREEVIANRIRINQIQVGIIRLGRHLDSFINASSVNIAVLHQFLHFYLSLNSLVNNAQELVIELVQHFEDLGRQVDSLASGKLTPGVISPSELQSILMEISSQLPSMLQLPVNPQGDLWSFYQSVKCDTLIDNNKILIILDIPLVNQAEKMDIFKVINLPLPYMDYNKTHTEKESKTITARYDLEAQVFAIDHTRTRYSLLSSDMDSQCTKGDVGFCRFIEPLYPVNLSPYCVVNLFVGNRDDVKRRCITKVSNNNILPVAKHIQRGLWVVALNKPLMFTFTCDYNNITVPRQTKILNPPVDVVSLPQGCIAFSSKIMLPSYKEFSSSAKISATLPFNIKNQNFTLWEPLHKEEKIKRFIWNLTQLDNVEEMKMDNLIETLKSVKRVKVSLNPIWKKENIIISSIIFCVIVFILAYVTYRCYRNRILTPPVTIEAPSTPLAIEKLAQRIVPSAPSVVPVRDNVRYVKAISPSSNVQDLEEVSHFNIYPSLHYA